MVSVDIAHLFGSKLTDSYLENPSDTLAGFFKTPILLNCQVAKWLFFYKCKYFSFKNGSFTTLLSFFLARENLRGLKEFILLKNLAFDEGHKLAELVD